MSKATTFHLSASSRQELDDIFTDRILAKRKTSMSAIISEGIHLVLLKEQEEKAK